MTKRSRILITLAAAAGVFIAAILIAVLIIVQTAWFQNFVRGKIVSITEDATGGRVEIGSFSFSLRHLNVAIKNFVLHGSEPSGSAPLLRIDSLDLELKILSSFSNAIDLEHLGIVRPVANIIVFPDGRTNIPKPKAATNSSGNSGLQTIVDLAVKRFELTSGTIHYLEQSIPVDLRGENLLVALQYDARSPAYQGSLKLDPIVAGYGRSAPLAAHLNVPVHIEGDAVRIDNARLFTAGSQIALSASIEHMADPTLTAKATAHMSLPEMEQTLGMPKRQRNDQGPSVADAELAVTMNSARIDVAAARLTLGESSLQASGRLKDPAGQGSLRFDGNLALGQLARLADVAFQPKGTVTLAGAARLGADGRYVISGSVQGHELAAKSGAQQIGPLSVDSGFHVDPDLMELSDLSLRAFGGEVRGKAELRGMRQLAFSARLNSFNIQKLMHDLGYKPVGYSGSISGDLTAGGDVKAKGISGYVASLRLNVAPGNSGIPVTGHVAASFAGRTERVSLEPSYLALPHTRLDLVGVLGSHLTLSLVSHNLNDFLPALSAASPHASPTMPVTLEGGTANLDATIDGALRSPAINGTIQATRFAVENRTFDRLSAELHATSSGASIANGILQRRSLDAQFGGTVGLHGWNTTPASPLSLNAAIHNAGLDDLLALAGEKQLPLTGTLNATATIGGTIGNPLGNATANVSNGAAYGEPIEQASATVNFSNQLVTLQPVQVVSGSAHLTAGGTYNHSADSLSTGSLQLNIATNTISLSQIKPLQEHRPGFNGDAQLTATLTADLAAGGASPQIFLRAVNANISAKGLKDKSEAYGDVSLTAHTANGAVIFAMDSNMAGSTTAIHGATQLVAGYPTILNASIQSLDVKKVLLLAGEEAIPAAGILNAKAHSEGPLNDPQGNVSFEITKGEAYGEPFNSVDARLSYQSTNAQIQEFRLDLPAGSIRVNGTFNHPAGNFTQGTLVLHADSDPIQIEQVRTVEKTRPGLKGTVRILADLNNGLDLREKNRPVSISNFNGSLSGNSIQYNSRDFGGFHLDAKTAGKQVVLNMASDLAKSAVQGSGHVDLTAGYPVDAHISFSNIRYVNLQPLLAAAGSASVPSSTDALVAGTVSVKGPLTEFDQLTGELNITQIELSTTAARESLETGKPMVLLRNQGPVDIGLNHSQVSIRSAHLTGRSTDITAAGNINFTQSQPLNLKITATADLGLLQQFSQQIYSSGSIAANVAFRGTPAQPLANGQVDLRNASVNLTDSPNGISNANGVITLNGSTATIRNLTAESGGGKITMNGFAALTGTTVRYSLRATGAKIRTRYSGVSVISSAALTLNGTLQHSLLAGTITVTRIALQPQSDAGSILSATATPPETPSAPSGPLEGMRLDVHVVTSSGLAVQTSMSQNLSANADLMIRGTLIQPGALGQVTITQGNLVFFGNEYSVNRGVINFYDPTKVEPILDIALQTSVQGVNVTLGVTGPIDNMKLNYRSDPPLRFDEIVSLLAAGKTPTTDPTIAAHQPTAPDQSLTQMGESAIVSQAVAAPISSRLQRVFGVNQIKIDPTFTSGSSLPQARLTLQQQISPTIVFTYTTDLTDTTAQIIKVEWAFTPRFSAVATRNEFGIVSLDFYWKKQAK